MNNTSSGSRDGPYLIVMADVLIREDLRQTILETAPEAEIFLASDCESALTGLAAGLNSAGVTLASPGFVAFVAVDPTVFAASALSRALAQTGVRVVMTNAWDIPETPTGTWAVLPFPFTAGDVQDVLANAPQPI